jgi:prolyl-tRNA editing enzyme YbaK/EbsC (Cys-tRNA(Pro) deacylase)
MLIFQAFAAFKLFTGIEPDPSLSQAVRQALHQSGEEASGNKRGKETTMSIESVREYLKKWGRDGDVLTFDTSSATVELAAKALDTEPARIAKTIALKDGDSALLIVTAGDTKIDNARFKAEFGFKARMLTPEEAVELVGHAVGGVCPFAVKDDVTVYLDKSLERFQTVFPACGSSSSAIELSIPELEKHSGFSGWVDVCKGW